MHRFLYINKLSFILNNYKLVSPISVDSSLHCRTGSIPLSLKAVIIFIRIYFNMLGELSPL